MESNMSDTNPALTESILNNEILLSVRHKLNRLIADYNVFFETFDTLNAEGIDLKSEFQRINSLINSGSIGTNIQVKDLFREYKFAINTITTNTVLTTSDYSKLFILTGGNITSVTLPGWIDNFSLGKKITFYNNTSNNVILNSTPSEVSLVGNYPYGLYGGIIRPKEIVSVVRDVATSSFRVVVLDNTYSKFANVKFYPTSDVIDNISVYISEPINDVVYYKFTKDNVIYIAPRWKNINSETGDIIDFDPSVNNTEIFVSDNDVSFYLYTDISKSLKIQIVPYVGNGWVVDNISNNIKLTLTNIQPGAYLMYDVTTESFINTNPSTTTAIPNRLMQTDSNGRSQIADPVHNLDIANKIYVDNLPTRNAQYNVTGGIRMRLEGNILYITNNGSNA
jgi:hypothetical protein